MTSEMQGAGPRHRAGIPTDLNGQTLCHRSKPDGTARRPGQAVAVAWTINYDPADPWCKWSKFRVACPLGHVHHHRGPSPVVGEMIRKAPCGTRYRVLIPADVLGGAE
jgi:hypothetical protein